MDPEFKDRVRLTADAVESLLYYYARPEPFVYSLADYLLLLYFEEACLQITYQDSVLHPPRTLVQTTSADELEYRGIDLTDSRFPAHTWRGLADHGILFTITALRPAGAFPRENLLDVFFEALGHGSNAARKVSDQLITTFCREHVAPSFQEPPAAALSSATIDKHLECFSRYLDGVLREISLPASALGLLTLDTGALLPDDVVPLNLFTVVRYRPSTTYLRTPHSKHSTLSLNYTARILWSPSQIEWAKQRLGPQFPAFARFLSAPVGDHSHCVADTVFHSGSLSCGVDLNAARHGEVALDRPADPDDVERHRLETDLYGRLGANLKIVYFPIHVGGTPWLALYSFATPESWRHYLHLYRQIIPYLGNRIREEAKAAFLDRLVQVVEQPIRDHTSWSTDLVDEINAAWLGTSLVFPFPAPRIIPLPSGETDDWTEVQDRGSFEIGDIRYTITFPENAVFFPLLVEFDQLARDLRTRLAGRIRQELVFKYTGRALQLHGVFNLGHELKNAIGETGWDGLLRELETCTPQELIESDFLERARRGLHHMLWPASLVGLIATLGKAELQRSAGKDLRDTYLDTAAGFEYEPHVIEEYRRSTAYLVNYVSALWWRAERPFQIVEWTGAEPMEEAFRDRALPAVETAWHPEFPQAKALEMKKIRFSPISRENATGQPMRFAVACLLSEAIRNAAKALTDVEGSFQPRWLIWSVSGRPSEVIVRIANTLPKAVNRDLKATSTRLVDALGRMLGIGSVSRSSEVASDADTKVILTLIHLHPDRLGNGRLT